MNIVGMGPLEILVVLLLAFILLGPQKMMEGAKLLGKASREIRRMADEVPNLMMNDEPSKSPRTSSSSAPATDSSQTEAEAEFSDESVGEDETPVSFQTGSSSPETDEGREK